MRKPLLLATCGFILILVFMLVLWPARVAVGWFLPANVALSGVTGTVWQGSASQLSIDGHVIGGLTWDARTLSVSPWDKNMVGPIEKAILKSDLGLNPSAAGQVIRIPLPPLTEERRRDLTKVVHNEGENAKIAIRNIRRDANHHFKELLKEKEISEDDERKAEHDVQTVTDVAVKKVDEIVAEKEQELLEI